MFEGVIVTFPRPPRQISDINSPASIEPEVLIPASIIVQLRAPSLTFRFSLSALIRRFFTSFDDI